MIPSILVRQLEKGLNDYIETTFPMSKTNAHDGLQEHWYCFGKLRKKNCDAKNIRGYRYGMPAVSC